MSNSKHPGFISCDSSHDEIRILERRLLGNPDDASAYYRLGFLYECVVCDDARAKQNYLNHLVRSIGYNGVEEAVTDLEKLTARDGENHMAYINLGQIYGYRNRFDEAEELLKRGTKWILCETEHFRLNVIPGSTAHKEIKSIKKSRERGLARIEEIFAVRYREREPIVYYFYESRLHKGLLTGDQMPGHVFVERREVHAVYNNMRRVDSPHEDTHIVLRVLGRPTRFFEEGAAEYIHHGDAIHTKHQQMLLSTRPGSIRGYLSDKEFEKSDLFLTYPLGASFVGFLITRYGIDAFKLIYGLHALETGRAFVEIYGKSLMELESEWHSFLTVSTNET